MTMKIPYEGWGNNDPENRVGRSIGGDMSPKSSGWTGVGKKCMAIPVTGTTEIGVPECGECAVFSDIPLQIAFETPDVWLGPGTEFRFVGRTTRFFVRGVAGLSVYNMGRLVIYYGRPNLGVNWKREDPRTLLKVKVGVALAPWAAGADTVASGVVTYPYVMPASIYDPECVWIWGIEWTRAAGNVEGVQFAESVSGLSNRILSFRLQSPSDRGSIFFPYPFKLSCAGIWYMYGSIEGAITACTLHTIESWN